MAERHERRSIADAMQVTPDAMAFIKGSPHKTIDIKSKPTTSLENQVDSITAQEETMAVSDQITAEKTQGKERASDRRRTYRSNSQKQTDQNSNDLGFGLSNLLVPLTTRLQPATAAALKRAGLEQKLNGREPSTVQEIVQIAVHDWLIQNNHIK